MGSNFHAVFYVLAIALVLFETCTANPLPLPQPGSQCIVGYCPKYFANFPPRGRRAPSPTIEFKTNAQRLAGGIPLNPPIFRMKNAPLWNRSPAPASPPQPRASPDSARISTIERCGVVALRDDNDKLVGYVGSNAPDSAYIRVQEDLSDAVTVCFTTRVGRVRARNVPFFLASEWELRRAFPLLGLVQGVHNNDTNIGPQSTHYLIFGGVELPGTPPLTPAVTLNNSLSNFTSVERGVETSVWSVNTETGNMIAQWTNEDGSQPDTYIYSFRGILYATGDPEALLSFFQGEATHLTMKFIET
ncbi:hypothetical protein JR316_0002593 [Psilocybe cubensis]|uniref:Uncharacterized protein n=2 Tax=Psilocybe cubensis TaxID=181762 RepID=A0ACB8HD12_PSICU|nr:hypothetical protein JR316_0002593 [Psilocybe cubensis]KAH9485683.1 hypothetical protein JR316_0002593 [Psilocybe cubensis]